jgi:hypothetical protein
MVIAAVMFGGWTLAYGQTVARCFKEKTYGLPLAIIFMNVGWEFVFAFEFVAPGVPALVWGNRLWFFGDVVVVTQVFLYGKDAQTNPWVKKHFYLISVAGVLLSTLFVYYFAKYFNDVYGLALSFMINFVESILFIDLLLSRPTLRGLPYGAAWTKMIGTAAGALFCYLWWPMQFDATGTLIRAPHVQRPQDFHLLYFLYLTIPVIDCLYIYLYREQRKALSASARLTGGAMPV